MSIKIDGKSKIIEEIDLSITTITGLKDPHHIVHEIRRSFKKIRSYMKLLLGPINYRQENIFFRDLGAKISEIRDLSSSLEALDQLKQDKDIVMRDDTYKLISTHIIKLKENGSEILFNKEAVLEQIRDSLKIKKLQLDTVNWNPSLQDLNQNFHLTLLRVKTTGRLAIMTGDTEDYHEWRKKVKDLRYQIDILTGILAPINEEMKETLHRLSNYLGWDHDLAILTSYIPSSDENFSEPDRQTFLDAIQCRRKKLKKMAIKVQEERMDKLIGSFE